MSTQTRRRPKPLDRTVGESLGPEHIIALRKYFQYLFRDAHEREDWKAVGCLRGIHNKLALMEALVKSTGRRLPPKRSFKKKVAEGQLRLLEG